MEKVEVGQQFIVVPYADWTKWVSSPTPVHATVMKVGRKYFELNDPRFGRFEIDTLRHDGGEYSPRYRLYASMEIYNAEQLHDKLLKEVQIVLNGMRALNSLSSDQLTKILTVLKEK